MSEPTAIDTRAGGGRFVGAVLLVALAACQSSPRDTARETAGSGPTPPASTEPAVAADYSQERGWVEAAQAALAATDLSQARAHAGRAVNSLLARPQEGEDEDDAWLALLATASATCEDAQDFATAEAGWRRVVTVRERTLPEEHIDLQKARSGLAWTLIARGDLAGARALQEQVLQIAERSLPPDALALQAARGNLGTTLYQLGDLQGARVLAEAVLEVRERVLPEDHSDLQAARGNLAAIRQSLGDLAGSKALSEQVLEVYERTLPDDHPYLQKARGNLALTIKSMGDLSGARALEEQVLEIRTRTLPDEHYELQVARGNLAETLAMLGDLEGARVLVEKVIEVHARTLPADHPALLSAQGGLSWLMMSQGDLPGARAIQERVLAGLTRTLPDDHSDLQTARMNLAKTLKALGDLRAAKALEERVLEVLSATLPDDHPNLQAARGNLAATLFMLGDRKAARALEEQVLEVYTRTLPDDHPNLTAVRNNLAVALSEAGEIAEARKLQEAVLAVHSRTLPDDHPELHWARRNLGATLVAMGELEEARVLLETALETAVRSLPDEHPDLQTTRIVLAGAIARQAERASGPASSGEGAETRAQAQARCGELIAAAASASTRSAVEAILTSSSREAEERCASLQFCLDACLSYAQGHESLAPLRELEPLAFALSETSRSAGLRAAALRGGPGRDAELEPLRNELRTVTAELARLARSEGTLSAQYDGARARRDQAERELMAAVSARSGGEPQVEVDAAALSSALGPREALVAYRRHTRWHAPFAREAFVDSLGAFVLRADDATPGGVGAGAGSRVVDLGPADAIEDAVNAWRDAIGATADRGSAVDARRDAERREAGARLRALIVDPLLPALEDCEAVVVVLDDLLHLVAVDALPLAGSDGLVGERWRIETRATASELLSGGSPPSGETLVALGGAAFNSEAAPLSEAGLEVDSPVAGSEPATVAAVLRGTVWERGFAPLTHAADEARGVGALYAELFETRPAIVLEKRQASREALEELAPRARFLHLATHGWFAPESIPAWGDVGPSDGQALRSSGQEQVAGLSPMLLCGLALAGANQPADERGRIPGLVTAEELAALDLSGCELAVLSACDTSAGIRRAGQGVASLQKALHMAGARSVITSLWKVPDEATKVLMLDFYRRLWAEGKPKGRALWEAKMALRAARDESGAPLYTPRDWAGWVLTGDPD